LANEYPGANYDNSNYDNEYSGANYDNSNYDNEYSGAANFTEAMKMGTETYHHLKNVIKAKYGQDGMMNISEFFTFFRQLKPIIIIWCF